MALIGIGRYVVKGIHGKFDDTTGFVSAYGAVTVTSSNSKVMGVGRRDEFPIAEHRDGTSSVFAVTADEPIFRLSIRWTPMSPSSSGSLALARTNMVLPDPLDIVTLAGFGNNQIDGAWYYTGGGSIDLSSDGLVEASMELSRYGGTGATSATITEAASAFS